MNRWTLPSSRHLFSINPCSRGHCESCGGECNVILQRKPISTCALEDYIDLYLFRMNVDWTAWVLGSVICKLVPYLQGVSVCASVYTLVAVAVERYRSISSPWRRRPSSRCCRAIIGLIWIGAAIITLPWLVVFRQDSISDTLVCCVHGSYLLRRRKKEKIENNREDISKTDRVCRCARKNGRILIWATFISPWPI